MFSYEIRLLRKSGETSVIYQTICPDDERAKQKILTLGETAYDRFEIWRGMEKIAEGARIIVH